MSSSSVDKGEAIEAEEREERRGATDRDESLAEKPADPVVEEQRAKMLAELDELLKLGRDGVVKKIENDMKDER
jgi:hypothetical protein